MVRGPLPQGQPEGAGTTGRRIAGPPRQARVTSVAELIGPSNLAAWPICGTVQWAVRPGGPSATDELTVLIHGQHVRDRANVVERTGRQDDDVGPFPGLDRADLISYPACRCRGTGAGHQGLHRSNVITLTEGTGRGLSLPQFVRLSSSNVARWLGLYPKKGALQPGSDADLAVYARGVRDVVRSSRLLCKQRWTPYEGRRVDFRLEACMLRGAWVYKDATIQAGPIGEFISCASATAS